ncbi:MAG: hypothetical protein ACI959_000345 [Limisphaerales bacterium]|jgi:hypothetical protein
MPDSILLTQYIMKYYSTLIKSVLLILTPILILAASTSIQAQELQCNVNVVTPSLKVVDPLVFRTFEEAVYEFMNTRTWTNDKFKADERIKCELSITITEELSSDRFKAQIAIQSSRPVLNSDYSTVSFNWVDKDVEFTYAQFQPLDFNENASISNLTSLLAFYAYVVIGLDYDSFSPSAGTPYFLTAQKVMNNAQSFPVKGWKSFDGNKNRYWIVENLLNPKFSSYRDVLYKYHRLGLDKFSEDQLGPIRVITQCIMNLNQVHQANQNSMAMQIFFNAKSDEIVGILRGAPPAEKNKSLAILVRIDPTHASEYRKLSGSGR